MISPTLRLLAASALCALTATSATLTEMTNYIVSPAQSYSADTAQSTTYTTAIMQAGGAPGPVQALYGGLQLSSASVTPSVSSVTLQYTVDNVYPLINTTQSFASQHDQSQWMVLPIDASTVKPTSKSLSYNLQLTLSDGSSLTTATENVLLNPLSAVPATTHQQQAVDSSTVDGVSYQTTATSTSVALALNAPSNFDYVILHTVIDGAAGHNMLQQLASGQQTLTWQLPTTVTNTLLYTYVFGHSNGVQENSPIWTHNHAELGASTATSTTAATTTATPTTAAISQATSSSKQLSAGASSATVASTPAPTTTQAASTSATTASTPAPTTTTSAPTSAATSAAATSASTQSSSVAATNTNGASGHIVNFVNQCSYDVWPAAAAGDNNSPLPFTGFHLASGASQQYTVNTKWTGRFWGRTGCSFDSTGAGTCQSGDCGGAGLHCNGWGKVPATLAEVNFGDSYDWYDISLVDGFNLPMEIIPIGGTGSNCISPIVATDMNKICPPELAVWDSTHTNVVGCTSACNAFGNPEYCCSGAYSTSATCGPSVYSKWFSAISSSSYSYSFDDQATKFCVTDNWQITFCPSGQQNNILFNNEAAADANSIY